MKNDPIRQYVALQNELRLEKLRIEVRLQEINGALSGNSIPETVAAAEPRKMTKRAKKPSRRRAVKRLSRNGGTKQATKAVQSAGKSGKGLPKTAPAAASKPRAGKTRRPAVPVKKPSGARGSRIEAVINVLQAAGKGGLTVKEVAAKTGSNYRNMNAWFHSTGKKIPGIKKLAPGTIAWVG